MWTTQNRGRYNRDALRWAIPVTRPTQSGRRSNHRSRRPSRAAASAVSTCARRLTGGSTRTAPHGYDAGKKLKGKKRRIPVDTCGLSMHRPVDTADWQDRDGGAMAMSGLFCRFPVLPKLYADGGCR